MDYRNTVTQSQIMIKNSKSVLTRPVNVTHNVKLTSIISNYTKLKLLEVIIDNNGSINITAAGKNTNTNHQRAAKYLDELVKDRILNFESYGRIKIYSFNDNFIYARRLKIFLELWRSELPVVASKPEASDYA